MSTSATPSKESAPKNKPLVPPDERFWQRYSPHHEFPLSSVASFAVHFLAILLVVLVGIVISRFLRDEAPIRVDAVVLGGGGGNPRGVGDAPGVGAEAAKGENVPEARSTEKPTPERDKLPDVKPSDFQLPPELKDDGLKRLIEQGSEAAKGVATLTENVRADLARGLAAGVGQGGAGRDGGKDKGKDKGTGPGAGPGDGKLTQREKRVLRWTMVFNTRDGNDYARQLHGLGAILALPTGREGEYKVLRNLAARPAEGQIEDLSEIKRIYWVDSAPDSVASLSRALQLKGPVNHIVAFFPEELEKKLLERELKYRGLKEEEIRETRFEVRVIGGKYEPNVVGQL